MSFRYLDEFLGLECAPAIISHKLFPNAKEITESMAAFTAVRKYILSRDIELGENDAIVCVGDGNTPRTAALFAYRLPHVQCVAIDPALLSDCATEKSSLLDMAVCEDIRCSDTTNSLDDGISFCVTMKKHRNHKWTHIDRLHVVPKKIQNVNLRCHRAIIVLMHAHVSLYQVDNAIKCTAKDGILGVIAVPCCNFGQQQALFQGHPPDVIEEDQSIISEKNELRIWCPRNKRISSTKNLAYLPATAIAASSPQVGVSEDRQDQLSSTQIKKRKKKSDRMDRLQAKKAEIQKRNDIARCTRERHRVERLLMDGGEALEGSPGSAETIGDGHPFPVSLESVKDLAALSSWGALSIFTDDVTYEDGNRILLPLPADYSAAAATAPRTIRDGSASSAGEREWADNGIIDETRSEQRVDPFLVLELRSRYCERIGFRDDNAIGEDRHQLVCSGTQYAQVVRSRVVILAKKYESAFLLILIVGEEAATSASSAVGGELQIVIAKRYYAGGADVTERIGSALVGGNFTAIPKEHSSKSPRHNNCFDGMRDAVRVGDVVDVVGLPGRTSFGDLALFCWDLFLVSIVLPQDVIHIIEF